jgi:hypothetical protein
MGWKTVVVAVLYGRELRTRHPSTVKSCYPRDSVPLHAHLDAVVLVVTNERNPRSGLVRLRMTITRAAAILAALWASAGGWAADSSAVGWTAKDRVAPAVPLAVEPFRLQDVRLLEVADGYPLGLKFGLWRPSYPD